MQENILPPVGIAEVQFLNPEVGFIIQFVINKVIASFYFLQVLL